MQLLSRLLLALVPSVAAAQRAAMVDVVHEASISTLQDGLRTGRWTATQLVDAYLARIAAYDQRGPGLNAVIRLNPNARRDATRLDLERRRGSLRGPLHGIPVLLKDNFDTFGLPTSASSLALAGVLPPDDAFVVKRLRDAGAIILGKTNMHELAAGITSISSLGGQTRNPYDPMRCPGGSSGGTGAAIAASFAAVGWGSDTCGSIRIPSAFNNLVGLRPTQGLASRDGIVPLSRTQDIPGPLARSVGDLAIALDVTIGYDPADMTTRGAEGWSRTAFTDSLRAFPMRGTRIAVLTNYMTGDIEGDIRDTVRAATRAMVAAGAEVVDVRIADFDSITANTSVINFETDDDLQAYLGGIPGAPALTARGILERGLFHDAMAGRIIAMDTTGNGDPSQYPRNLARQRVLRERLVALMDSLRVDAIAYPTSRRRPVFVGDAQPGSTCLLSAVTGLPALSAPAGFTNDGMPVGIEFLGRPRSDVRLVGLAFALEQLRSSRKAPSTTPALRGGRAPAPVVATTVVRSSGALANTRFTWDATTNQLRYEVKVTGLPASDLQAVVVRRTGGTATGAPVIHRMAGPGMLSASGAFPLSGQDRGALERGALTVALFTTRGMQETALRLR
jgi:Asp-tRNA(Asn)/Glu-tRNA(Gln) amidotransferase A subunit family amidase